MNTQKQVWDLWSYDVWGNADDGYDVNDRHCLNREIEIEVKEERYNIGTEQEFGDFIPTDEQMHEIISEYFDVKLSDLEFDGDDMVCYINLEKDAYPLCELHLISPEKE